VTYNSDFTAAFASSSAADTYDEVLVPRLFTPCAQILLSRLAPRPGETLLDVACGTGIVVRLAAPLLGPAGLVIGRDINEAMVVRARSHAPPSGSAHLEFGVSPAAPLDLDDESVDAVTCQQGLQFFPEPDAALAEMRRCLRPSGRVGIAVWFGVEECPLWAALEAGLAEKWGAEHAAGIRRPFSWPGADALTSAMTDAGFTDIQLSDHTVVMHFEGGVRQAMQAIATTPFAAEVNALDAVDYELMMHTVMRHLGRSTDLDATVDIPARTWIGTAVRG
jgi:ubiquinone/menaquinone biosynthesis C-methylase UbiE